LGALGAWDLGAFLVLGLGAFLVCTALPLVANPLDEDPLEDLPRERPFEDFVCALPAFLKWLLFVLALEAFPSPSTFMAQTAKTATAVIKSPRNCILNKEL